MAEALVTNNAVGTLSSSITDSDLTLTLNSGQGALFPNPTGGNYFWATILTDANEKEIVKVTARATNTLTIVRAQQSTTARAFDAGDRVELRFTAGHHDLYAQTAKDNDWTLAQDFITETGITGAAATTRVLTYRTGTEARWKIGASSTAEAGANAGSDLAIYAYDDDGSFLGTALTITRSTRQMTDKSSNKFDAFASGTAWPFFQTAAPTGWTIVSQNNKAVRIVSSNGGVAAGSTAFTSVFAARTITSANLPTHTHASGTLAGTAAAAGAHSHGLTNGAAFIKYAFNLLSGTATGFHAGSSEDTFSTAADHTHTVAINSGATGNGAFANDALDFAVQYCDMIICSKDA